ncbi:MAG: DUF6339 family protein [Candidatus Thiodiazotropha taylori]
MSIELFPRLYSPMAESCFKEIEDLDLELLAKRANVMHPMAAAGETGGIPVSTDRLQKIRDEIVILAHSVGYPERVNLADFDVACARYLYEKAGIPVVEAYRDEVWSFLAIVLLPDISIWRFEKRSKQRLLGGVRNTFQRLWLRGHLIANGDHLHEKDWRLLRELTEDAFVAIIERPRLSASPLLAREIAEGWRRSSKTFGKNMETVHRIAVRNLMATKAVISLEGMNNKDLGALIDSHFNNAIKEIAVNR